MDINSQDCFDNTAFRFTIKFQYTDCTKLLIKEGVDVNRFPAEDETPLTEASKTLGSSLKLLLEAGADVNAENSRGNSALSTCILFHNGDEQVVIDKIRLLFRAGAYINKKPSSGQLAQSIDPLWKTLIRILFAAGENLPFDPVADEGDCLKDMCRRRIRQILIDKDPRENLLVRIPQLGLPSLVTEYLLYGVTLDD